MTDLHVEHLVAAYGSDPVLVDTTLHVAAGSLTCILGPSGCGKTTLLRVIAGFEPARAGRIRIGDRVVDDAGTRMRAERRNIGYVPQDGSLFPHMNIADNVGFALSRTTRAGRAKRAGRIAELLALVGMPELAGRFPHQLSGGQQQRVAVARALARRPELILLDEPFAALDATLRAHIRNEIRDVLRAAGVTALLVTHDRAEALSLGDEVAVMYDGRIAQSGTPQELYRRPVDGRVARFVGDATLVPAVVDDGTAATALGPVAIDPHSPVTSGRGRIVIRPEQLRLEPVPVRRTTDGVVTRVEYFGHDARVEVRIDNGGDPVDVVARIPGTTDLADGAGARVVVEPPVWVVP